MFTPNNNGLIAVRVENARITAGDAYRSNTKALSTSTDYIQPSGTTWDKTLGAKVAFTFYIETAGNYQLWIKARSLSGSKAYVWLSLDGDEFALGENKNGRIGFNSSNFEWQNNGNETLVTLFRGRHEIVITSIHEDLQIEGFIVGLSNTTAITNGSSGGVPSENFGVINNTDLTVQDGNIDNLPVIIRPAHRSTLTSRRLELRWVTNGVSTANRWLIRVGTGRIGTAGVAINDTRDINETIVENPNGASNLSLTITDIPISKTNQPFYVAFWWRNDTDTSWNRGGRLYQFSMWDGETLEVETYQEWLENPNHDDHRLVAIESDSSEGTTYLASKAWLSNEHKAYDDWLVSVPFIEESLGDSTDIGDIEFINPELTENPLNLNWHGYRCRMYIGDDRWNRNAFRLISSSNIEACTLVSDRIYRLELIGDSEKFNRTFYTGESFRVSNTVRDSIAWVMNQWDLSGDYNLINIPEDKLDLDLDFEVNESSTMQELLTDIALSAEIERGISQTGQLFFVDVNDNPSSIVLNEHNVADNTLSILETIYPVKQVIVNYGNDESPITELTQASTGNLNESVTFNTYLERQIDAQAYAYRKAEEYSNIKNIYEMDVIGLGDILKTGDIIQVMHPMLLGIGYISAIRRKPLFDTDTIEITI